MKKINIVAIVLLLMGSMACEPNTGTKEGKEAVKMDTVDPREGDKEGDMGDAEIGGYEDNQ